MTNNYFLPQRERANELGVHVREATVRVVVYEVSVETLVVVIQ